MFSNMSSKESIPEEIKTNEMNIIEPKLTVKIPIMQTDANISVTDQALVVNSSLQHMVEEGNNYFPKAMEVSNVLQACQNYDLRYQRELLKSGITLSLNQDDYCEQVMRDDTAFRLACAKYLKNYQTNHPPHLSKAQCQETEDQAQIRRAQNAQRMRNYRQSLRSLETEQQAAERRAQNALRMRNYREFKREIEPEIAAEHRAKHAERMRNYRKIKRELEPQKAACHRAQNALRMRNYRRNKRLQESITKVD